MFLIIFSEDIFKKVGGNVVVVCKGMLRSTIKITCHFETFLNKVLWSIPKSRHRRGTPAGLGGAGWVFWHVWPGHELKRWEQFFCGLKGIVQVDIQNQVPFFQTNFWTKFFGAFPSLDPILVNLHVGKVLDGFLGMFVEDTGIKDWNKVVVVCKG